MEQITAAEPLTLYNYLTSDLRGLMKQAGTDFTDLKVTPGAPCASRRAGDRQGKITSRQAKDMLAKMFETGADPTEIIESENIGVSSDMDEMEAVVSAVIAENDAAVAGL